jgi:hypothetical protein
MVNPQGIAPGGFQVLGEFLLFVAFLCKSLQWREWLAETRGFRSPRPGETFRELLIQLYGQQQGRQVRQAAAFEVSEYGSQPSLEELKMLFPFFD